MKTNTFTLPKKLLHIALVFTMVFAFGQAWGQKTWDAGGDGTSWSDAANWSGNTIPLSTETVTISRNGSRTVNVDGNYSCASLTLSYTGNTNGTISVNIQGSNTLSVTGALSLTNSATNGGSNVILDVAAGTLTCASISYTESTSNTSDNSITLQNGTITCSGNITMGATAARNDLTVSGTGTINVGGTFSNNGTFTPGTGTVNYNGAAQTARVSTYNNLTLSGSGIKTFATTPTVNGILSMEGTATATVTGAGVITYGPNATLQYNTATSRTASSEEWITPFVAGSGGVIIANTGVITLDAAKVFNASVPLTINSGASLSTNNLQLTFGGDFINGGTFTAGSSNIVIANTATQSIAGFTTTGTISMTKTTGTATLQGNVTGTGLTMNGNGGTLNLGTGLTHTFTTWTRTNGTLNGGSSILIIEGDVSGVGGTFTSGTGTVEWNAGVAQAIAGLTYYNLSFLGSGNKTADGPITVSNSFTSATATTLVTSNNVIFNGTTACGGGTITANNGTVTYGANSLNVIEGTYSTLLKNGGNTSTLCGAITVNTALQLGGGIISLGTNDLTFSNGAVITPTVAFSSTNMVETSDLGNIVKQSTTEAGFEILYPIGSSGYYTPMDLTNGFTATVAGTGSVTVRAVTDALGVNMLGKYWQVSTTNLSAISAAHVLFTYNDAEINGTEASYITWVDPEGVVDWKNPTNPTITIGSNTFGSTGSGDFAGRWSAGISPVPIQTWYAYSTDGNWANASSWTLDGASNPLYENPSLEIPTSTDIVVIPSGKKITISAGNDNLTVLKAEVNGTLDLTTSTGHNFGIIAGNGTIKTTAAVDNFPTGNANLFNDATNGGTFEINGTGISLNTARTFNNLKINLTSGSAILLANYTLNGNLTVTKGDFKINDATNTTPLNLTVAKNVLVTSLGTITVGTANATGSDAGYGNYHKYFHVFTVSGNFTNQGSVRLTNQTSGAGPNYNTRTNTGAVSLVFTGLSNNTLSCEGITDLYYLVIDKGTNQTYSLTVNATEKDHFSLFGDNNGTWDATDAENPENRKALWIKAGSLILEGFVTIPSLGEGGTDFTLGENAALVLNGTNVFVSSTAISSATGVHSAIDYTGLSYSSSSGLDNGSGSQGIYVNGALIVNDGEFTTNYSHGVTYRGESASTKVEINGGTIITGQLKMSGSTDAANAKMSYIQTGGEFRVVDDLVSNAIFDLSAILGSFIMSGGTISIEELSSGATNAINIDCQANNISVTGGTIILDNSTGRSAVATISTTAPFHNFILRNNQGNGVQLQTPLEIKNDLTIEADDFNAAGFDLSIGSDLNITGGATYTTGANTTTFDGAKQSNLYLPALQTFNNLTIAKTVEDKDFVIASGLATAFEVTGAFRLENGIFDYGTYTAELNGSVYLADTIGKSTSTGKIYLNGGSAQTLNSVAGCIQNLDIDNINGVTLTGNLGITGALTLTNGVFGIGTYKLTMSGANAGFTGTYSTSNMVQTAGNSSDGGIEMYVDADETLTFPFGVAAKYTPAVATFTNFSDDGYVQIRPSDNILKTTNSTGGDILSYYWRVSHSNFTAAPTVQFVFTYNVLDDDSGTDETYVPGKVLDEDPYTRSYENILGQVDDLGTPPTITFIGGGSGFTLENANYTAGIPGRFSGAVKVFYTRRLQDAAWANWETPDNWTYGTNTLYDVHDSRQTMVGAGEYPKAGDIAVIGWVPYGDPNYTNGKPHGIEVVTAVDFGELRFSKMLNSSGQPTVRDYAYNFQFRPTICMHPEGSLLGNVISGEGMFWIRSDWNQADPSFAANDLGGFVAEDSSYFLYESTNSTYVFNNIPAQVPNLLIATDSWGAQDKDFTISTNVEVMQNFELLGDVNLILGTGLTGDITVGGDLRMIETSTPVSGGGARIDYPSTASRSITVMGDLKLNNAQAIIHHAATDATVNESYLNVYGNIVQNNTSGGGLILYNVANQDYIKLSLLGTGNHIYTITSGTIAKLYNLTVDKGTDQTSSFTFNDDFDLGGPTLGVGVTKALELLNGTLILNDAAIDINLSTGDDDFLIPSTSNLTLTNGTARVNGLSTGITLDGGLTINGGTLNMESGTETYNNYIQYGSSGDASIDISSGTLLVGNQIRRLTTSSAGVLNFNQSGGIVTIGLNTGDIGYVANRGMLEVVNAGSNFSLSGAGTLTLVRQNGATPEVAALYLDPDTYDITGSTIVIGNGNTPTAQNDFGINSSVTLNNLTINTSAVVADYLNVNLATQPLTIQGDLTVGANGTIDGKGLNLTLTGNFINNGIYTASNNTLIFNSGTTQSISGGGTEDIFRLTKTAAGTLTLGKNITVNDLLDVDQGTINTATFALNTLGNVTLDAIIASTSGSGLVFGGMTLQNLARSGVGQSSMGIVTVNNSNGVRVSNTGHSFFISNALKLQNGVFNIGGSLLELGTAATIDAVNPFTITNMIQTNSSFQDNGVKKNFPANHTTDFVFPVGQLLYTPVTIDLSSLGHTIGTTAGSLTVRPANEYHPTINDPTNYFNPLFDIDNVLQYYWILRASGITGLVSDITMVYDESDVLSTDLSTDETNYIAASILTNGNPTEAVSKFTEAEVDQVANEIVFTFNGDNSNGITGDYFAGNPNAIPANVLTYTTTGTGGNVNASSTYTTGLPTEGVAPSGAVLIVDAGDEVIFNVNDVKLYKTIINAGGTLTIDETNGHRLGTVTGTGNIKIVSSTASIAFPAGDYIDFFDCAGGGVEYAGTGSYTVMSGFPSVRNLTVSGSGTKELANNDIVICDDFIISGPIFENASNNDITINRDLFVTSGTFNSGASNVIDVAGIATINGGTYNCETSGDDSFGELIISSGAFNTGSGGSISVQGDVTFSGGTFNGGSGSAKMVLNGSANQNITGTFTGVSKIRNLEVNNNSGVTLVGNVTIDNSLTLTNGLITTGSNTLLLNSGATISPTNGTSTKYVNGKLSKILANVGDDFNFPVGKSGKWGYAGVYNVTVGGLTWDVEYFAASATNEALVNNFNPTSPTITSVTQTEYWKIDDNGSSQATISLSWNSTSNVSAIQSEREELEVMVWNDVLSTWDNKGGGTFSSGHTQTGGSFLSTSLIQFSENIITLGSSNVNNPLPINLISFTGFVQEDGVMLNWVTQAEENNNYFELLRSMDGVNFNAIGTVDGAGDSSSELSYSFVDKNPNRGINYYRLRQVDFDGKNATYSIDVPVDWYGDGNDMGNSQIKIYPNPYNSGILTLDLINFEPNTDMVLSVYSLSGVNIANSSLLVPESLELNISAGITGSLAKGIYLVRITTATLTSTTKLVVN